MWKLCPDFDYTIFLLLKTSQMLRREIFQNCYILWEMETVELMKSNLNQPKRRIKLSAILNIVVLEKKISY